MPAVRLRVTSTAMSTRKPAAGSERCGVSTARKGFWWSGSIAWLCAQTALCIHPQLSRGSMARARRLKPDQIAEIFRRFRAAEPEPKGELQSVDPFTLLVAVVLSAQATDAGVNRATATLFKLADTPEKMIALGEEGLTQY